MTINKKKIGKKIYYDGYIWDVVEIKQPNKSDSFIIISRKEEMYELPDGTKSVEIECFDLENEEFFPYNKETKELIVKLIKNEMEYEIKKQKIREKLLPFWMVCVE